MDLHKVYYDGEGNPRTVLQLVKMEPEWAANRIQEGERAIEQLSALKAEPQTEGVNRGSPKLPEWAAVESGEKQQATGTSSEPAISQLIDKWHKEAQPDYVTFHAVAEFGRWAEKQQASRS